jgi:membrane protein required for beta-lactamase induction
MTTALLIIFALVLEYVYDPISNMKDTRLLNSLFNKFKILSEDYISEKYNLYLLFPISVFIITTIILFVLGYFLHPLFKFLFSLIILIYCLKPSEFNLMVENLKFSFSENKELKTDDRFKYILPTQNKENYESIVDNLFYNSTRSTFTVIFSFLLLGPAGCLGFIVLDNYIYSKQIKMDLQIKKKLKVIISIIEYIPIRLSIFSYAIVSDFEVCMKSWSSLKKNSDLYKTNIVSINQVGRELTSNAIKDDNLDNRIEYIQTIIARSFLAWLSLIALLVLGGFFI